MHVKCWLHSAIIQPSLRLFPANMQKSASLQMLKSLRRKAHPCDWVEQLCLWQQSRQSSNVGQAVRRRQEQPNEAHSAAGDELGIAAYVHAPSLPQLLKLLVSAGQNQLRRRSNEQSQGDVKQTRPPDPDMHFFNHPVAAQRPRKPVQWFRPGLDTNPRQPNKRPAQAAAQEDPWLLGEADSQQQRQPHARPRQRLPWAQKPAQRPSSGQLDRFAPSQQEAERMNGIRQPHHRPRLTPQQEAQRQQRMALAAAAPREQYLRHQAIVQQQVAEHAMPKHKLQQQAQKDAATSTYATLNAASKPKAAPLRAPPPVQETPQEIVIPADVTVRQLAQLLSKRFTNLRVCSIMLVKQHCQQSLAAFVS